MISQERLKELLIYNPDTGDFSRRVGVKGHEAGEIVGTIRSDKQVVICVDYEFHRAHRLAWLYMTGNWPEDQIDHIDGNRGNNKWNNLRAATASQNQANRVYEPGASGARGVHKHGNGWRAKIKLNGKIRYLGTFPTVEEAAEAYKRARIELFGEYNHPEVLS